MKEDVFPCHRLDRQTIGLIIYAKSLIAQRRIMQQFMDRDIKKKYIALVRGRLSPTKGLLEGVILDKEGRRFKESPKKAITKYRTIKAFKSCSIVELSPLTGRTNQLRIQLADSGHPILGEDKYAFRRDFEVKFKRLALHAAFLSFVHPFSQERVELSIRLPSDMNLFLEKITKI